MSLEDDPVWQAYLKGKPRPRLAWSRDEKGEERPPLILTPARLPDPSQIPPRQWLYGTQLIRGYVSVLVAPGGAGKSSYAMAVALALASGRELLGEHIFKSVNGSIFNLEDPLDELDRRLAALMIRHNVRREEVAGRIFLNDGEDRRLVMASMGEDGVTVIFPDEEAMIAEIITKQIGLVVCDPFVESHSLEENNNPQMAKAAAVWRRIARATNCAIFLVHHTRKGDAVGIEAARGAKALTDSARVGLLLTAMSESDGEGFGIKKDDCSHYVRLDDAKHNMAPAAKAKWFHMDQVALGNCTPDYPKGDRVAAIVSWEPTNVLSSKKPSELNEALDIIRDGPSPGVLFTFSKRGENNDRWVGSVLISELEITEKQAKMMIDTWVKSGLLWEDEYKHPEYRRQMKGVRVNENKRPD